jgi:hypothetical protein
MEKIVRNRRCLVDAGIRQLGEHPMIFGVHDDIGCQALRTQVRQVEERENDGKRKVATP